MLDRGQQPLPPSGDTPGASVRSDGELERIRAAMETARRRKNGFLRDVSHAVWTPMNGVLGLTALALETDLSAEQREYLTQIQDSASSLLAAVDDIVDFAGMEDGRLALEEIDFDLRDTVDDAIVAHAMHAEEKGIHLASSIEPGIPHILRGDASRLRQVLAHLIGNAVKFTDRGEVLVRVAPVSLSNAAAVLSFSVSDTGIGIAAERREGIFEAVLPEDVAPGTFSGRSFGLAISRYLVGRLGGSISVESTVGRGSTFSFTARLARLDPARPREPVASGSVREVPILVAVSNRTSRRGLRRLLTGWGMWPRSVESVDAALVALSAAKSAGNAYRIVLLDGGASHLDGFALASAVRLRPELADVEILMVSAGRRGDIAQCERIGISGYLSKPYSQGDLFDAIRLLLGSDCAGANRPFVTRNSLSARRRSLRILLAEDDAVSRKLATRLLENRGHTVLAVQSGRKALEALAGGSFDLLLTDVQMADLDGLELAAAVRSAEEATGGHLPIVALTAHARSGDRARILAAGIDGYVSKPIRAEKLFDAIDQASAGVPPQPREPDLSYAAPEFERVRLLAQIGGDTDLLEQMVELYGEDFPPLVGEARRAIEEKNADGLGRAAHALKSLVCNFHAEGAFHAARRLELLASERDLVTAPETLAALETRLSALHESLLSSLRMEVIA